MEEINELIKCCVILHNMIVEVRSGSLAPLGEEEETDVNFPLFGRQQISNVEAALDGVDLFAARVAAFDSGMQGRALHMDLKMDLVEHIFENH